MTHHNYHGTAKTEHCTDFTVEDAAGLSTSLTTDVDTFVVERHTLQTFYIILSIMADDAIGTGDGNGQTTTVVGKAATDAHILRRYTQSLVSLLTGRGYGLGMFAILSFRLTLCCQTFLFRLTEPLFGSLTFFLIPGSLCFPLGFLFPRFGLGNTTGILASGSLSSGFLTRQFGSTFLGGLRLSTLLGLSGSLSLLSSHLLSYQSVNLSIQCGIFLLLLGNDVLDGLLFLLQRIDHRLLFGLLAFQCTALLLVLRQQYALVFLSIGQLLELLVDLLLFLLYLLTLCTLETGIFAHKTHAPEHLHQVVGTENEHQLTLRRTVAVHISHRLHIIRLALVQLVLQLLQLRHQHLDFHIHMTDILTDGVYRAALAFNLVVEHHQVLQPTLDILFVVAQTGFLFLDFLLYLLALVLQGLHSRLGRLSRFSGLSGFTGFSGFAGFLSGRSGLLRRRLPGSLFLLRIRSQGEGQ